MRVKGRRATRLIRGTGLERRRENEGQDGPVSSSDGTKAPRPRRRRQNAQPAESHDVAARPAGTEADNGCRTPCPSDGIGLKDP